MTMGEKILHMRKARGWSQEELAERMNVSRQAVSRWESGAAKPDADKIIGLCDLFGVSADYLLREDYAGEHPMASASRPVKKANIGRVLLQLYAVLSAVCLFVLKFMSSVNPKGYAKQVIRRSGDTVTQYIKTGVLTYVMYYNLEWLLVLLCAGLIVGLAMIWQGSPKLRERVMGVLKRGRELLLKK